MWTVLATANVMTVANSASQKTTQPNGNRSMQNADVSQNEELESWNSRVSFLVTYLNEIIEKKIRHI